MTSGGITGVLGHTWRALVTPWGAVEPCDGSPPLTWHVAADDRWHAPAEERAVRQIRLHGAPVFETRLRVPGGDAIHRVWSVADAGGCTVVEVVNDSPLPIACAFGRPDLLTTRPPTDVPIQGIDLPPAETVVLPIGHRSTAGVALAHDGRARGPLPPGLPGAEATARGWVGMAERASRVLLPDANEAERLVAARCDDLLAGPPDAVADPAGFLLALSERARTGEDVAGLVPDVASAVETIAARPGWDVDAALDAAALVLAACDEPRAVADVVRIAARRELSTVPPDADGIRAAAAVERRLARGPVILPEGIPAAWRGVDFEAHGLPIGPASTVSFAVRWHGERPAVLWEVAGAPAELSAPAVDPSWRTREPSGEALWRVSGA